MAAGVVLPAYHPEPSVLQDYLTDVIETVDPATIRVELDDVSTTPGWVDELDERVSVNTARERRGKGAAITDGFDALETDVVAFADADGSVAPESLADVIVLAQESGGVAVGTRYGDAADVWGGRSLHRHCVGQAFAAAASVVVGAGVSDYQCGAKALTMDAWLQLRERLYEPEFIWDAELLAVASDEGVPIAEVPVQWREGTASTVGVCDAVGLAGGIVRLGWRFRGGNQGRGTPLVSRREQDL